MSLLPAIITGLALGSMYGLLALGFHVTYAVSGTVNFSHGSSMTLGAVAGYFVLILWGWPAALGLRRGAAGLSAEQRGEEATHD